ncbi:MAG: hypothetical protein Q9187_002698 [Circinaria calcarea]
MDQLSSCITKFPLDEPPGAYRNGSEDDEGLTMQYQEEKGNVYDVSQVEKASKAPTDSDIDVDESYTYKEQREIIHRVDRRLVTMCGVMYCISLMDRTNLSAAAIAGYASPSL